MRQIGLLLLVLGLAVMPVSAQEETPLHPGDRGSGAVTPEQPEALITLIAEAGQVVDVLLTSEEIDPQMSLVAPDGSVLASDDDSWGNLNAYLRSPALPESGEYTLRVSGMSPTDDYARFFLETRLIDDHNINFGDTMSANLRADDFECALYNFWGHAGDVIAVQLENYEAVRAVLALSADQASCSERARIFNGEVLLQDVIGNGLDQDFEHIVIPHDGVYSLMMYRPLGYAGTEAHVTMMLERLAERSLDGGSLSVRLSPKEPSIHLHMTLFPRTSSSDVEMIVSQQAYTVAYGFSLNVIQNGAELAQFTTPPSSEFDVLGLSVGFQFAVVDGGDADITITTDADEPVIFSIQAVQYFGEG